MSVKGLLIAAKTGKKAKIFRGTFVAPDPGNASILVASEDGNLIMKSDGTIEVQPVMTIRGDIDFSTGGHRFHRIAYCHRRYQKRFFCEGTKELRSSR